MSREKLLIEDPGYFYLICIYIILYYILYYIIFYII